MRGKGIAEEFAFDLEIERTLRAKLIAEKLAQASAFEVKETLTGESMEEQNNPPSPPR
jgi:hypothetical protein